MILLDGKQVADQILTELSQKLDRFPRKPGLAFILVGDDPASQTYIRMKKKKCSQIGILSKDKTFPKNVSESELLQYIESLNTDPSVDGILIQQPLPSHLNSSTLMEAIYPQKDVDGFHPINMGRLLLGEDRGFIPCTPLGVQRLLAAYHISLEGKHVVIVGRSNIVGKPLGALLIQKKPQGNATVTLTHSSTKNLAQLTTSADILIAALGQPRFIRSSMIKPGSVVVDVGINRTSKGIVGDVDFQSVSPLVKAMTPVPGGIGPMTIAMLLSNTVQSLEKSYQSHS